jgi:hypothetical protein
MIVTLITCWPLPVIGGGALIYLVVAIAQRVRAPADLRGDWWTKFERDFREYASRPRPSPGTRDQQRSNRRSADET